jgi:hypothetical protein
MAKVLMMRDLNFDLDSNHLPSVFHPKFCDTPEPEHYCLMQYIHYTIKYLPRFISVDIIFRC